MSIETLTFSMADIKTQYFNELVIDRVFDVFANMKKIQKMDYLYLPHNQ